MISFSEVIKSVEKNRRDFNLNKENYWGYFSKDGSTFTPFNTEHKDEKYIGFFIEDDSKLRTIYNVMQRKVNKL